MTPAEFLCALRKADRHEVVVYHTSDVSGRRPSETLAAARGAHLMGLVTLGQRRVAPNSLAYEARRTGEKVPVSLTADTLIARARADLLTTGDAA